MDKLNGRIALVIGGAGQIGGAIARQLLQEGATVIVPSRSPDRLDRLQKQLGDLANKCFVPLTGNIGNFEEAEKIGRTVRDRFGRIDTIVASLGGGWQSRSLLELNPDDWNRLIEDNLTTHFIAGRALLPILLRQGEGSYTIITRGEKPDVGYPGSMAVAAAGLLALSKSFSEELKQSSVRLYEIRILPPVANSSHNRSDPSQVTSDQVGQLTVALAANCSDRLRGDSIILENHRQTQEIIDRAWQDS